MRCVCTTSAPTHLIVDVNGYFPSAANFGELDPARLLDTRRAMLAVPAENAALLLINQLRASHGLRAVSVDATMHDVRAELVRHDVTVRIPPQRWALRRERRMDSGSLSPEVAALELHNAFLASPTHLANMVNPAWTAVGVGVHTDGAIVVHHARVPLRRFTPRRRTNCSPLGAPLGSGRMSRYPFTSALVTGASSGIGAETRPTAR